MVREVAPRGLILAEQNVEVEDEEILGRAEDDGYGDVVGHGKKRKGRILVVGARKDGVLFDWW